MDNLSFFKFLRIIIILPCIFSGDSLHARKAGNDLRREALSALKNAVYYYYHNVASHGGYVYYYSEDLGERWGEGKATKDMIFVQPPGTPTVGLAYLKAFDATGDSFYLKAAREAAGALVYGQLVSGGWTQVVHFAKPEKDRMGKYRSGNEGSWNYSSLDDGQTQAALEMLMYTDKALEFKDAAIHESVTFGLNALLNAQFPNGAFPQVWQSPVVPQPILRAKFPDYDWRTEGKIRDYWNYYTLNDNIAGKVADVLIKAHQIYKDEKFRVSLKKLGDFFILAQMPEPQPGWCQQYNYEMVPIWARKFEPPAITAWEAQDVMETLIRITRYTGDKKYLEPILRALEYYQKRLLPDGKVARYYEFGTNKPLYMNANYELSYDDSKAPAHYGWKQDARFDQIAGVYKDAVNGVDPVLKGSVPDMEQEVRRIISELDKDGRWISTYQGERLVGQPKFKPGFRYLSSEVFSRNIEILSGYIASHRKMP